MKCKSYIIIGKYKDNGSYIGEVENSFSMGLSDLYVRVWSGNELNIDHLHEKVLRYNKEYKAYVWNVYRVGSKNCPVKINWDLYYQKMKESKQTKVNIKKYFYRNLQFKSKS